MRYRIHIMHRRISGSAAVEFAIICPLFLLLMFAIIKYATVLAVYVGVQELVAESARATVGGLSNADRDSLARAFIQANVAAYPYLDPTKLTVSTGDAGGTGSAFQVTISYDMSTMFAFTLAPTIPMPGTTIVRSAVIQNGGY